MQEVTNSHSGDGGEGEGVTILRDQGRGRHTVVLAPQRRGHFRVAIVVHNRWSRTIVSSRTSSLGRTIAVGLRMRNGLNLQVISSHLPSGINMKSDEVELRIQDLGNLVAGLRRHRIIGGSTRTSTLVRRRLQHQHRVRHWDAHRRDRTSWRACGATSSLGAVCAFSTRSTVGGAHRHRLLLLLLHRLPQRRRLRREVLGQGTCLDPSHIGPSTTSSRT